MRLPRTGDCRNVASRALALGQKPYMAERRLGRVQQPENKKARCSHSSSSFLSHNVLSSVFSDLCIFVKQPINPASRTLECHLRKAHSRRTIYDGEINLCPWKQSPPLEGGRNEKKGKSFSVVYPVPLPGNVGRGGVTMHAGHAKISGKSGCSRVRTESQGAGLGSASARLHFTLERAD